MIFSVPLLGILIPAQEILKPTIFSVLITNKQTLGKLFFLVFFALHLHLAWSFIAYALLYIWSDFKSFRLNWQSCHEMLKKTKKKQLFQIFSQLLEFCFQLSDKFELTLNHGFFWLTNIWLVVCYSYYSNSILSQWFESHFRFCLFEKLDQLLSDFESNEHSAIWWQVAASPCIESPPPLLWPKDKNNICYSVI